MVWLVEEVARCWIQAVTEFTVALPKAGLSCLYIQWEKDCTGWLPHTPGQGCIAPLQSFLPTPPTCSTLFTAHANTHRALSSNLGKMTADTR